MDRARNLVLSFMVFTMIFTFSYESIWAQTREPSPPPDLSSIAYAVYDGDHNYLILGKNEKQKRSIASITKIMTLLCVVELVEEGDIGLHDKVIASSRAASREGTQINLKAGDEFTLEELLYATALVSANDAAVALAEYVDGSEAAFTNRMNAKAQELNLKDTNYVDCTGLLSIFSNNYSTAMDQVKLLQIALEHELLREILRTPEYNLKAQDRIIKNSHPLLENKGVAGGKTGATTPAGHTLITSCTRDDRHLIIVVLGARSRDLRNQENEELLEWAFANLQVVIPSTKVLGTVLVPDGVDHEVNAVLAKDFSLVFTENFNPEFETELELWSNIRAPIERGHQVGELIIKHEGQDFTRLALVAQQGTGLATWLRRIWNAFKRLLR